VRFVSALALVALLWPTASPAQVVRVSVSTAGEQGNRGSLQPSISGSGRFVAFISAAVSLVPDDVTPQLSDVLVHDRDADADGVFDEPGAVATTRVSNRADGASANGSCHSVSITADGRFGVFISNATDLVAGVSEPRDHVYRFDRTADRLLLVSVNDAGVPADRHSSSPRISDDGRYVVFVSAAANLGDGSTPAVFLRDVQTATTVQISERLPRDTDVLFPNLEELHEHWTFGSADISADGTTAAFSMVRTRTEVIRFPGEPFNLPHVIRRETGSLHSVSVSTPSISRVVGSGVRLLLSAAGDAFIVTRGQPPATEAPVSLFWLHPETGRFAIIGHARHAYAWSRDGRSVVTRDVEHGSDADASFFDLVLQRWWPLPFGAASGSLSSDGRFFAFDSTRSTLVPHDTNGVSDVFVADLHAIPFDTDADTLDDRWELFFGLSVSSAGGDDGAAGDPDGDGVTNAQEQLAGTHPRGTSQRHLAEGAGGTFFDTRYDVFNPSAGQSVTGLLVFTRPGGAAISEPLALTPSQHQALAASQVSGLTGEFSVTLESDAPLVVERTMTWAGSDRYGSHAETAIAAPSATWYLAEGSTVADFNLFYLLQNPRPVAATAAVRFLRPNAAPVVRTYELPPRSRLTIHVNEVPGLADTDVAAAVESTQPIVVERAMYADRAGQLLGLGHGGLGAPRPSTTWYLAEGATGPFFDAYVVIANPSTSPAALSVRFLTDRGTTVTREVTVAPERRVSLFVDAMAGLEDTSFATVVTSTNGVPVVVERAMYWPGGFYDYYEGHSSVGVTAPATRWATAGGWEGGAEDAQTYVLIANVSDTPGQARIRVLAPISSAFSDVVDLPPNSRTTVPLRRFVDPAVLTESRRFPVVVESLGASPVPIVVERATYATVHGVVWAAGVNAFATPVP
jgi:hypothetical protein